MSDTRTITRTFCANPACRNNAEGWWPRVENPKACPACGHRLRKQARKERPQNGE